MAPGRVLRGSPPWRLAAIALGALAHNALAFGGGGGCPKGFGNPDFFDKEWGIPAWPQDMTPEHAGKLRTVTLGGFGLAALNEEYLEGPTSEFMLQGRETYWQASGDYFMYYCVRFRKWRIAGISAFSQNRNGQCFAFVSDGHADRDVRDPGLIKGWIEVENGDWATREEAGVVRLGTLGDQMEETVEAVEGTCEGQAEGAAEEGAEALPFGDAPKKKTTRCPVKLAAGKVMEGVFKIGKWIRRLFPQLLGAPPEDAAAEEAAGPAVPSGEL
mmetsp:Transcript_78445/g.199462  ORF Transcript_78445/g.199462 Transcript_78445/m.199462 type:complete len:272 (+) Transcript_78445:70-885(+)